MKNVILFFLWIAFFVLIIFNFKAEEAPFLFYCSLVLAIIPTIVFIRDVLYHISKRRNRMNTPVIGISIIIIVVAVFTIIFYFLPDKHAFSFVVFMWIITISSSKLKKGGIVKRILWNKEIKSAFYSLSPFH